MLGLSHGISIKEDFSALLSFDFIVFYFDFSGRDYISYLFNGGVTELSCRL